MIIPIDDDHRISSDAAQWILQERRIIKEIPRWDNVAYFARLDGVIRHVFELKLRLSEADTLVACIREAERLHSMLSHALKCIDIPKEKPPLAARVNDSTNSLGIEFDGGVDIGTRPT